MNDEAPKLQVVGIGASAGGIESLKDFFSEMPDDSGLAFVVVQHLDPNHASYMADLLARHTKMKVAQAQEGSPVRSNCVYTIPPNKFLSIEDGVLHLTDPIKRDGLRMPIDFFFRSLTKDQDSKAIAVLFSGSGSDGTLGIREIRGAGGLVIVQNPESAQFDHMIASAIDTGLVDYILPVREIPRKLLEYIRQTPAHGGTDVETIEDTINSILDLLVNQTKNDFRCYKKTTVQRRIERRMGLNLIRDIGDYYRFVSNNPDEQTKLAKDMLIGVTSFFRDPDAFNELSEKVIVPLVQQKKNADPLRVWIAGCATGEEAYSIVILLMEEMARLKKNTSLQVFASDIDKDALKSAREGIYSQSIVADVSEERLARFFGKKDSVYQVVKGVREVITFAEHNVITNPPFMRMDLISCRNLMIYVEPEMQKKIANLFAFALKPRRYLFLGKSDGLIGDNNMFEPISKSWHIFRRQQSVTIPFESFPMRTGVGGARLEQHEPVKLSDLNQQVLLRHFNASMVLINERGDIKHFYGATRNYLEHPSGDANLNLYEMIDNRHSLMLRLAVDRAAHEQNPGKLQLAGLTRGNEAENTEVTIMPVMEPKSGGRLFAVIFEPAAARPDNPAVRALEPREGGVDIVAQLEAENQRLKQDLQVTKETFQTTHEEFTAANEEALAINEELQSTNEELETSKEELQSLNEELVTLNGQLNDKVGELGKTNDDLANFLNTSEVDTLFLDRVFSVRRFTPSATRLLNLIPSDVGRPLSHISNKLVNVDLIGIADDVLRNLGMIEKEVQSSDGLWYMLRCIPYRTLDNVIDGVVFTFTDISRLKLSEEAMMEARKYAENIIDTVRECLLILDSELKVVSANRAFYETFRVTPEETQNRLIDELGDRQWNIPRLSELLREILQHDVTFEDFRVEHDFPKIGRKIMALNARRISGQKPGQPRLILLAIEDVTEEVGAEAERKNLREQLFQAQKMESFGTLAAGIAHDFNNILNIIQGYASVLGPNTSKNEIAESVKVITDTSKRGASLTRQLLTLARKIEPQLESTDLNALLDELLHLLQQIFPKNIEVTLAANHKLPVITADLNQINQALLNLCVNARDAMPNGGKLTIKAKVVVGQTVQELRAGDQRYVCIEIADTGVGMGDDIQSRIFEPFFTTKNKGEGTGLGLSVAYGIITNHGGLIRVKSKPQQGTTFQVYLPVKE